jgi:hypothetical protein
MFLACIRVSSLVDGRMCHVPNGTWRHERNTINLLLQVFLRMNTWMFETCRRNYNQNINEKSVYFVGYYYIDKSILLDELTSTSHWTICSIYRMILSVSMTLQYLSHDTVSEYDTAVFIAWYCQWVWYCSIYRMILSVSMILHYLSHDTVSEYDTAVFIAWYCQWIWYCSIYRMTLSVSMILQYLSHDTFSEYETSYRTTSMGRWEATCKGNHIFLEI